MFLYLSQRMFSAKGFPWSGDRSMPSAQPAHSAAPRIVQKPHSEAKAQSKTNSTTNESSRASSVTKKLPKSNSVSKESSKPSSSYETSQISPEMKEIKRKIRERRANIVGLQNRIKRYENGEIRANKNVIELNRHELIIHEKCLTELLRKLPK